MNDLQSACPACGRTAWRKLFRAAGDDGGATYDILLCPECGLARTFPQPAGDVLASFYNADYYGPRHVKFEPLTEAVVGAFTLWRARVLQQFVPRGGRILDVGCGRGIWAERMLRRGYDVTATERWDSTAADAQKILGDRVRVGDIADIPLEENSFDLAVLWHVLEHVTDPLDQIQCVRRLLRAGGHLVIAVPNFHSFQSRMAGRRWFHLDVPRHLWHFSPPNLRRLLQARGFECIRASTLSLEQNPFGILQSALNCAGIPQNRLYKSLKSAAPISRAERFLWRLLYVPAMIPAACLSIAESLLGRGGTFYTVAKKSD